GPVIHESRSHLDEEQHLPDARRRQHDPVVDGDETQPRGQLVDARRHARAPDGEFPEGDKRLREVFGCGQTAVPWRAVHAPTVTSQLGGTTSYQIFTRSLGSSHSASESVTPKVS